MSRTVRLPARAKQQGKRKTANVEERKSTSRRNVRVVRKKQTKNRQDTKPSNASTSRSTSGQKKCSPQRFVPPKLPEKPKVTVGSKCYGKTRKGQYIVCRFFVTQWAARKYTVGPKKSDPWFVIDLDEKKRYVARGTKTSGYPTKEQAIKVARRYRDEFGAWHVMPF